jgi:hypothetical protein
LKKKKKKKKKKKIQKKKKKGKEEKEEEEEEEEEEEDKEEGININKVVFIGSGMAGNSKKKKERINKDFACLYLFIIMV